MSNVLATFRLHTPPPILMLCIALFAFAEGWLLLDIGLFVLFFFKRFFNNKNCPRYDRIYAYTLCRCLVKGIAMETGKINIAQIRIFMGTF